jgi:hypothetical protein
MRPKPSDEPVMKTRAMIVFLSENLMNETFANFESAQSVACQRIHYDFASILD